MQVTIDQAGRIVVPKAVRERLGLRKNSVLELEENLEGIVLKPVDQQTGLVRRPNGRWLIVGGGGIVTDSDIERLIQEARDERFADLKLEPR